MVRPRDFQPYTRPKDRIERSWLSNFYHSRTTALRSLTEMLSADLWSRLRPRERLVTRDWNTPLIVATLVCVVAAVPILYFWHRYQVHRHASSLLSKSQSLESDQRHLEAAEMAFNYLRLRPDDGKARVHLAEVYDKGAITFLQIQRATSLLQEAIGIEPENPNLRRRLAKRYLLMRQYSSAVEQADELLQLEQDDPEGWSVKASGEYEQARAGGARVTMIKAADSYKRAVEVNPDEPRLSQDMADIYRKQLSDQTQERRDELADTVMNRLVLNNPDSAAALLARYQYRDKYQLRDADADLDQALRMAGDDIDVLLSAGHRAMRRGEYQEAIRFCQRVIEKEPTEHRGRLALGFALVAAKQGEQALETWRKGADDTRNFWRPNALSAQFTTIMLHLGLNTADLLIRLNRLDEADRYISQIERNIYQNTRELAEEESRDFNDKVKFVRARWHVAKGDFYKAVPQLRGVLVSMKARLVAAEDIGRLTMVYYELAQCHAAQNQFDLAAAVYDDVVMFDNENARHYLAAGVSYELAGQPDKAVLRYETGMNAKDPPPELWVAMARAQMALHRNMGQESGKWTPFDQAMRKAAALNANVSDLAILEAEAMAARGERAAALERLHQALEKDEESALLWQTVILANQMWGDPAEADRWMGEYENRRGKSMATQLVRVALHSQRGDIESARQQLREAIDLAPEIERPRLLFQMAELSLREEDVDSAREQLRDLAKNGPENLQVMKLLGELALNANDLDDAEVWEGRLRSMEGNDGTAWRYLRARRLLARSESNTDRAFTEAVTLQETILTSRPSWPMGHVLRGQLEERRGRNNDAIQSYQRAIELGENNYKLIERVIALLFEENRIAEADRFLSRLSSQGDFSSDLTQVAIDISVRHNELNRALEVAQKAAQRRPNDPNALIRLGHTLFLLKRNDEALPVLQRAVEHAQPEDTRPAMTLLSFYSLIKRPDEARQTLEALLGQIPADEPARREFVHAQGLELIGDFEEADKHYRQAMELAPDNVGVQKQAANFYTAQGNNDLAEQALRQVVKLEPASDVRRRLAMLLARKGGEKNWKEAIELLELIERGKGQMSSATRRAQAYVLLERGGVADRRKALDLLEELIESERDVLDEDRVVLAKLYEQEHLNGRAVDQYKALVTRANSNPEHVRQLADLLLRDGQIDEADNWIEQLQAADPKNFRALELRVRWLGAKKRIAEVDALVEPFMEEWLAGAEGDEVRAERCARAGKMFADIKDTDLADRWFAKGMEHSPTSYAPYAEWLASLGRVGDAVTVILDAAPAIPNSQPMVTLSVILAKSKAPPSETARAESLIEAAVTQYPQNVQLRLALANLRVMQARLEDAEQIYRQALEIQPDNPNVLNNLALCLSYTTEKQAEALECINKAMERAGPLEPLQDTHAMVLLAQGKVQSSLSLLQDLVAAPSVNSVRYLHLALAHQQAGSLEEARWALQQARDRDLDAEPLMPRDKQSLERLEAALAK